MKRSILAVVAGGVPPILKMDRLPKRIFGIKAPISSLPSKITCRLREMIELKRMPSL
jgi:hypothetical protein